MGGLFESLGYSETERFYLYFAVCIWVRLVMAYLISALVQKENNIGKIIVVCGAVIAMLTNLNGILNQTVWWSRQAHFLFAAGVLMSILCGKHHMAGPIVVADTLFGIVHTLVHHGVVPMCPIF